jgi:hypothetical protein
MSRLSRQCGILNISQPYRPPRPVTAIALLFAFIGIHNIKMHFAKVQVNLTHEYIRRIIEPMSRQRIRHYALSSSTEHKTHRKA